LKDYVYPEQDDKNDAPNPPGDGEKPSKPEDTSITPAPAIPKPTSPAKELGQLGRGGFFDTSSNVGVYYSDELPRERRDFLLNYAAEKIVNAGMSVPAVMFLEMSRPLAFIGSQIVWATGPIGAVFINDRYINEIALLMEDRNNIEELCVRIESLDGMKQAEENLQKQQARQKRLDDIAAAQARGEKPRSWWQFWKK